MNSSDLLIDGFDRVAQTARRVLNGAAPRYSATAPTRTPTPCLVDLAPEPSPGRSPGGRVRHRTGVDVTGLGEAVRPAFRALRPPVTDSAGTRWRRSRRPRSCWRVTWTPCTRRPSVTSRRSATPTWIGSSTRPGTTGDAGVRPISVISDGLTCGSGRFRSRHRRTPVTRLRAAATWPVRRARPPDQRGSRGLARPPDQRGHPTSAVHAGWRARAQSGFTRAPVLAWSA